VDLRTRLHQAVFSRPHVFILAWPRTEQVRREAERLLRVRGWPLSLSPADTDVLLVLTPDGSLSGEAAVITQRFFAQMPPPAAQAQASAVDDLSVALEQARHQLISGAAMPGPAMVQDPDSHSARPPRHDAPDSSGADSDHASSHLNGDRMDGGADKPSGPGATHMGAESMPMSGDMMMDPGGVPLAAEAPDRDGLSLDVLHLGWGPALPWWPAGLQVQITIQGDVITKAQARIITATTSADLAGPTEVPARVAVLEGLSRLLFLAGADRQAWGAVRLIDALLGGAVSGAALTGWATRILRSTVLRSMLQRIPLAADDRGGASPSPDVWSRVVALLQQLQSQDELAGGAAMADVEVLSGSLIGRELGEARLIIAALTCPVPHPVPSGLS
jgi:hypothetical protein